MMDNIEFISFHDNLTGNYHTATWDEAKRAMESLQESLGRKPTRDELLAKVLADKEAN